MIVRDERAVGAAPGAVSDRPLTAASEFHLAVGSETIALQISGPAELLRIRIRKRATRAWSRTRFTTHPASQERPRARLRVGLLASPSGWR
jgi:hypothetical protein